MAIFDYHSNQDVSLHIRKKGEEAITCHGQPMSSLQIIIEFSCQWKLHLTKLVGGEPVVADIQLDNIFNSVIIKHRQLLSYSKMRDIIHEALKAWPICHCRCQSLIKTIISRAHEIAGSMSPDHKLLRMEVDVMVVLHRIIDESPTLDQILQQSIDDNNDHNMVPASDSSIKSLKRKKVDDESNGYDTCTICLVKFSKRYKTTCMPCSHMFHGSCIKKWLKTSHYCPICRFEMPTD